MGPDFHVSGELRPSLFWLSSECSEGCNLDDCRAESVNNELFVMNFYCIWSLVLVDVALETIIVIIIYQVLPIC